MLNEEDWLYWSSFLWLVFLFFLSARFKVPLPRLAALLWATSGSYDQLLRFRPFGNPTDSLE